MNKIYIANTEELKNKNLFEKVYNILSEERRNKVNEYKFAQDKILSVGSEFLLIYALKQIGINSKDIKFKYNENKKPYLISHPAVFFNLSHSENYVTCAISSDEIGCDIEKIKNINLEIAKRFFNKNEYITILNKKNEEEQKNLFFRYWTLKESFVKNIGKGINIGFNNFEITLGSKISVIQNFNTNKYYFHEIDTINDYKCAVCSKFEDIEMLNVTLDYKMFCTF